MNGGPRGWGLAELTAYRPHSWINGSLLLREGNGGRGQKRTKGGGKGRGGGGKGREVEGEDEGKGEREGMVGVEIMDPR